FLRQNFLTENFNYANFVTIGSYQYGLTNKITLGFNGFLEKFKKGNIGISPIFLIPKVGLLTPSLALSYNGETFDNFYSVGYEKNFKYLRLMLQYERSSQNFFKPKTVSGNLKESFRAFSNFNIPYIGSLSLSYFDRKYFESRKTKNLNISLTKNIFKSLNLTAAYNKTYNGKDNYDGYRFSLNMPLGYNHYSSITGSFDDKNQENYSFLFRKSNLNSLGVGYSFRATKSNGRNNLLGKISYNSHYTSTYLDFSYSKNKNTEEHGYRLGLYGSIIYIDNEIFFKRYVGSGFALVKIDPPVEGVKVLFNNRPIGTTDKSGTLFIGKIAPYIKNEIKIDPTSLNIRTHVDKTIKTLVPLKKHGYLIRFKSKKVNSVRLKIIFPDGTYPAPGLKFDVDNNINVGIIGFNGKAFIENITAGKHIVTVDYGYGLCSFELNIKEEWLNKIVPYIGEYTCVPQTDTMIAKKEKNIIVKPAKLVQNKKEEEKLKKFKKVSYKKPNPKDLKNIDKNINNNAKVNSNTYTIEVGKFDSKEIEKAVEEYEEFQKEVVKEGDIYKIYIGKFKTKEDAERFMKIFRLKGKIITVRD
ncbi:fimbria/pilus outer membrane usher protein, partial [Persephonella sp.]